MLQSIENYMNKLTKTSDGTYPLINPHTREKITEIPECTNEQMEAAIAKSEQAFQQMKVLSSAERSDILFKTSQLIEDKKEDFANTITLESGKPITFSQGEVDRTIQTLKFAAIEARKLEGESIRMDAAPNGAGRDAYTIFQPIGVVGAITPFNFPLNLVIHKVGPALAVGNTIIVKPAEKTPLSSILLANVLQEAGLPENAYQVITGDGPRLGKVLIDHPAVKKITFTGSPQVGKLIKSQAGLKKVTLELGSNSALYIDKSVESKIEEIANKAVVGAFSYNGQVCISTQRIYVHETVSKSFIEHFKIATEALKYGDPNDPSTDMSGLIDEKTQKRILEWIDEAVQDGATLITGGEKEENGVKPTILANVSTHSKVSCQEVFGPVVIINTVKNGEEALEAMNDSEFGLNAGVFTYDLPQGFHFAHELEVGQVLVNDLPTLRFDHMPYGGLKSSGYGYEGVKYAMREMVHRKFISMNYTF
ncbi:aldehyde dehydrogenase family protein [Aquibacillus sp. 3ASR75-11]|uniref:Aldehyde dehydrogenase family protein n=1 Tax=Terrihalobacillus insolitus TaxID=2950438 RepID=A0A9X4APE9_9BACI|nr:aldehyde dehydrogenase family protein [Terrihalobacillus insolitus]MDC3415279.1 aldehyde dehydrogenase family protein [Terrihalobacillus insolitus]MDC3425483.1 aldehyde dehydrogenase family protein [Terrihalobacillus insolitus]